MSQEIMSQKTSINATLFFENCSETIEQSVSDLYLINPSRPIRAWNIPLVQPLFEALILQAQIARKMNALSPFLRVARA
jgi:hypothetical protein